MRSALAVSLLALTLVQNPPAAESKVDFTALGKAFAAAHGDAKATTPPKLQEVLEKDFLRLGIGPFDLEIPRTMIADKTGVEFLRNISFALGNALSTWADWQGASSLYTLDMTTAVQFWTTHWKPVPDAVGRKAKSRDLRDVMPTTDTERALLQSIEETFDKADKLALVLPEGRQLRIILAPTRLEFMQWIGYAGLVDEASKQLNWFDDAAQWTQFWMGWDMVIALEYASWQGFDPTFKASQPMKKIGEGVMAQHVVQQATFGFLRACRPTVPENRYESALALVMTIEACQEVDTIDGAGGVSSSGAKTRPYSKFIPGGNPKGGTLPGRSSAALSTLVESRWRKGHGKDGFALPLKNGQLDGVKAAKGMDKVDPVATFVMHMEDNSGKHIVHAPFFGPHADEQEYPPGEFLVDFAEFYRAYKTGFFHWLEHEGVDPKDPGKKWSELVRGLAKLDDKLDFDALVAQVYGLPISGKDGSEDSLEWRFLKWVASQKTK